MCSRSREWVAEASESDRRAAAVADVLADPHRLPVTLLVGNNLVNITLSSLPTALLVDRLDPGLAVLATTVLATTVILIAGEIIPKSCGLGHAQTFALRVVRPLRYVSLLLYPVVVVFDLLTRTLSDSIGGQQSIEQAYDEIERDRWARLREGRRLRPAGVPGTRIAEKQSRPQAPSHDERHSSSQKWAVSTPSSSIHVITRCVTSLAMAASHTAQFGASSSSISSW